MPLLPPFTGGVPVYQKALWEKWVIRSQGPKGPGGVGTAYHARSTVKVHRLGGRGCHDVIANVASNVVLKI